MRRRRPITVHTCQSSTHHGLRCTRLGRTKNSRGRWWLNRCSESTVISHTSCRDAKTWQVSTCVRWVLPNRSTSALGVGWRAAKGRNGVNPRWLLLCWHNPRQVPLEAFRTVPLSALETCLGHCSPIRRDQSPGEGWWACDSRRSQISPLYKESLRPKGFINMIFLA